MHSEEAWGSPPLPIGLTLCVVCVSGMCRHVQEGQEDTGFVLSVPEVTWILGIQIRFLCLSRKPSGSLSHFPDPTPFITTLFTMIESRVSPTQGMISAAPFPCF